MKYTILKKIPICSPCGKVETKPVSLVNLHQNMAVTFSPEEELSLAQKSPSQYLCYNNYYVPSGDHSVIF